MAALPSTHYADHAVQGLVSIESNELIARNTRRLRFRFPELARRITPGQFLMIRLAGLDDPLIGRPLALFDTTGTGAREEVEVVYLVSGKMTTRLAQLLPGQEISVWGPLGNGFAPADVDHLIMVAGGIGQTPFLALAKEHLGLQRYGDSSRPACRAGRVTLCYGARSADLLAGIPDFERVGVEVHASTEDGSAGQKGLVTAGLRQLLDAHNGGSRRVVACGPEGMLKAVSALVSNYPVSAQVSLETPMACGIGICFSCVAAIRDGDGQVDYRRTCVEGPVFEADEVCWD
jgi:dihydroorotate dehydrogenase electron transfer subunit